MTRLIGIFFLLIFSSGCFITAAPGTRTEYQDKMAIIEKDYRDKKITKAEYLELKDRASQEGKAAQQNTSRTSAQKAPLIN